MESPRVDAVTHRMDLSLAIAEGNAGGKGEARGIIESVAAAYPEIELIAREQPSDSHGVIVWLGARAEVEELQKRFRELRGPGGEWKLEAQHGAAFVSVVGLGLGAREAAQAEAALERARVAVLALRVTPTALVFRVPGERATEAVQALHRAFLEVKAAERA